MLYWIQGSMNASVFIPNCFVLVFSPPTHTSPTDDVMVMDGPLLSSNPRLQSSRGLGVFDCNFVSPTQHASSPSFAPPIYRPGSASFRSISGIRAHTWCQWRSAFIGAFLNLCGFMWAFVGRGGGTVVGCCVFCHVMILNVQGLRQPTFVCEHVSSAAGTAEMEPARPIRHKNMFQASSHDTTNSPAAVNERCYLSLAFHKVFLLAAAQGPATRTTPLHYEP